MSASEQRKENERVYSVLAELTNIEKSRRAKAPGEPCVEVPLDKIFTFTGKDGEPQAVMPITQVIYLVDKILRMK